MSITSKKSSLILTDSTRRELKSLKLKELYALRLNQAIELFYAQVGDDEEANEALYESCNLAWKKTINTVNNSQNHTTIDPFAFQKQIESYKQIALEQAIKQQENGDLQANTSTESEPETKEIL